MADARRVALENVVRNAVNYREMARRSLGIIFLVLSEPDRQRFSEPFVQVLRDAVEALPLLGYPIWVSTSPALPARLDACREPKEDPMTCRRCQGCMARDHFLDLQESGGEWWLEGWRCINCGHVFDPVLERNRRLHEAALTSANVQPVLDAQPVLEEASEHSSDLAA